MADNGNAIAYGTDMCGGFYSPMEAHNVYLESGETVEDAVNRGSVTVLADGTKTYAQGLSELYALIDFTKISSKSSLQNATDCFICESVANGNVVFNSVLINSNNTLNVYQYTLKSSGSKVERLVNGAYTDLSSNTMNGDLTLFY